jgi:raffinose/stachyose/melibiose transport system permease protein
MIVPFQMVMFTLTFTADKLNLNTPWTIPIVYLGFGAGLAIFMFIGFVKGLPLEIEEAAAIDGCGPIRTFFHIILPQLKPVTASVIILGCMNCWNDFQFSRYILQDTDMNTVTLSISSFFSQTYSNLYAASASALLAVLPVVIVFLFLQKYFVQGMIDSAVK